MKIVFFGSGGFGLPALERLAGSTHALLAVVTSPDRKSGRGLKFSPSPIKAFAQERGIGLFQFEEPHGEEALGILKGFSADIFLVVAYGKIFKPALLSSAKRGCINLHASLLPKYRGAAPVAHALLHGEAQTGVTTFLLAERMDAGDILLQDTLDLKGEENAQEVARRLSEIGADLVMKTLDLLEKNALTPRRQDEALATYAPKLKKEDGWIDWTKSAQALHNEVRAYFGWPGSRTRFGEKEILLIKTRPDPHGDASAKAGSVVAKGDPLGIRVSCGQGTLLIQELQPAGGPKMSSRDFLNGYPLKNGDRFG